MKKVVGILLGAVMCFLVAPNVDAVTQVSGEKVQSLKQDIETEVTNRTAGGASEESIQALTESVNSLESKLDLLIETLQAQQTQADDNYTEPLGVSETLSAVDSDSGQPLAMYIAAGAGCVVAMAAAVFLLVTRGVGRPQTVGEAVDAIVARNQQIYGKPEKDLD